MAKKKTVSSKKPTVANKESNANKKQNIFSKENALAPTPHSGTFLQPWTLLRKALIRAAKTSHTVGTLYGICTNCF